LNLRFIGVDRNGLVYDFRSLLSDDMLNALIQWLTTTEIARHEDTDDSAGNDALDILFSTLARDMLTILDKRRDDWGRHLDTSHRLESGVPESLFDRASRYPDFSAACHQALRDGIIDVRFYGRLLRSIDLREQAFEKRAAAQIDDCLDPIVMAKLAKSDAGQHLGCYNWLSVAPKHAAMRANILARLPVFSAFFSQALLPVETWDPTAQGIEDLYSSIGDIDELTQRDELQNTDRKPAAPAYNLQKIASREESIANIQHTIALKKAVDSGQDRVVINALAARFGVSENTIRLLWHQRPPIGQPPTWHLAEILKTLDGLGKRDWPQSEDAWEALTTQAVPAEAI
jgi:hypothetical protein